MTTKEKIALNTLQRKLERGSITEEQAKVEYQKITGEDPEDYFDDDLDGDQDTGPVTKVPVLDENVTGEPENAGQKKDEPDPENLTPEVVNPDRVDTERVKQKQEAQDQK